MVNATVMLLLVSIIMYKSTKQQPNRGYILNNKKKHLQ